MSYSDLGDRDLGVAPVIVAAGVSVLSKLFGSKSGKTTHAQRFFQAVQAGDLSTAQLLVDQAYSHAFLEAIPDKADWLTVWNTMRNGASGPIAAYMDLKVARPQGTLINTTVTTPTLRPAGGGTTVPPAPMLAGLGGKAGLYAGLAVLGFLVLPKLFGRRRRG